MSDRQPTDTDLTSAVADVTFRAALVAAAAERVDKILTEFPELLAMLRAAVAAQGGAQTYESVLARSHARPYVSPAAAIERMQVVFDRHRNVAFSPDFVAAEAGLTVAEVDAAAAAYPRRLVDYSRKGYCLNIDELRECVRAHPGLLPREIARLLGRGDGGDQSVRKLLKRHADEFVASPVPGMRPACRRYALKAPETPAPPAETPLP